MNFAAFPAPPSVACFVCVVSVRWLQIQSTSKIVTRKPFFCVLPTIHVTFVRRRTLPQESEHRKLSRRNKAFFYHSVHTIDILLQHTMPSSETKNPNNLMDANCYTARTDRRTSCRPRTTSNPSLRACSSSSAACCPARATKRTPRAPPRGPREAAAVPPSRT